MSWCLGLRVGCNLWLLVGGLPYRVASTFCDRCRGGYVPLVRASTCCTGANRVWCVERVVCVARGQFKV
jgi:hypothetical protein